MDNVPGCYGAASVFARDSEVCQKCQVFDGCSQESLRTLEAIKGLVNVSDLLRRHDAARKGLTIATKTTVGAQSIDPTITVPVERKVPIEKVMFMVSHEQEEILLTIGVKPKEHARRLCELGFIDSIKSELQAGRNAFAQSKPRFIAVAIDMLIAGGFSKSELQREFLNVFNWSKGTASAHVSIICPILTAFNIAQAIDGRLVASPVRVA